MIDVNFSIGWVNRSDSAAEARCSALPGRLYDVFDEYKRDEWTRFLREVTNWDVERYLHCVP